MKKQFLVYIFVFVTSIVSAQLYEVGLFLGGSNYIGDIGSTQYINPNFPAVGGVAKFNWTPRINFRGTLIWTDLTAKDSKSDNAFRRNRVPSPLSFKNRILEGAVGIEFNFFKYNLAKVGFTQTPYIVAQIGLVNYRIVSGESTPTAIATKRISHLIFPFGVGYKMRLAENFGIALETTVRYTFRDGIDFNNHALTDPAYNSRYTFGNPNSDDWYVFTGITVVYAFGRPGCYKDNFF